MDRSGKSECWYKEGATTIVRRGEVYDDTIYAEDDWRWGSRYNHVVLSGKLLKKKLAFFHSDKFQTMNNAPKWYRQDLNRKLRTRQKAAIRTAFLSGDFDNLSLPKLVKDAAWYW